MIGSPTLPSPITRSRNPIDADVVRIAKVAWGTLFD